LKKGLLQGLTMLWRCIMYEDEMFKSCVGMDE
jgi:hypothetical protein